ncbi:MAG: ATPase, T2SS/T4P/T4SS family [Patescibacteria group bacterium]|jgi:twitching motility protein PilT
MDTSQDLFLKQVLTEGITASASDWHFTVGHFPIIKVNGDLRYLEDKGVITAEFMIKLAEALLTPTQQQKLAKDKEIILTYNFDKNLRFKINLFYQKSFLSATFRYVPVQIPALSQLGMPATVRELIKLNRGLVIVSGAFGSGRTSTAASMIEEINISRKKYIITIEDPIEYVFANKKSVIEQRQVGQDTNSYVDALRYFQEESGDVLFLEQLNSASIIPPVLEIARGSALVITTMAADTCARSLTAILDYFPAFDQERIRDLLSGALKAVVCQKLLPKIGGGVVPICEILLVNDTVRATIASGNLNQLDNIIATSRREGMVSFNQALNEALRANLITYEEAQEHSPDPNGLGKN